MINFETIYTAGSHKVTELRADAAVHAATRDQADDRRSKRTSTLIATLRLLAS